MYKHDFTLHTDLEIYHYFGGRFYQRGGRLYQRDCSSEHIFHYQPKWLLRIKCIALTLFTIPIGGIIAAAHILHNLASITRSIVQWDWRRESVGDPLLRIAAAPFALLALQFAALYGIFDPNCGRKLYGSLERAMYPDIDSLPRVFIVSGKLAPCFQPIVISQLCPYEIKRTVFDRTLKWIKDNFKTISEQEAQRQSVRLILAAFIYANNRSTDPSERIQKFFAVSNAEIDGVVNRHIPFSLAVNWQISFSLSETSQHVQDQDQRIAKEIAEELRCRGSSKR